MLKVKDKNWVNIYLSLTTRFRDRQFLSCTLKTWTLFFLFWIRSVLTGGKPVRACLMFECCQCSDNLCLLIIEEYSIFPWGVLQQYSVFTSESGRVLPPSSPGGNHLTLIFPSSTRWRWLPGLEMTPWDVSASGWQSR